MVRSPFQLKTVTSSKLILTTRWRVSSKHTTIKLKTPITYTTTKGTESLNTTTSKAETPNTSGRKASIPQRWNHMHNTLTPRHSTRLRYTTTRVVSVLVCHLPTKPLIPSPKAKVFLVTISSTILIMEVNWFSLRIWLWVSFQLWFFLRLLTLLT
jgi:hypothetical protein